MLRCWWRVRSPLPTTLAVCHLRWRFAFVPSAGGVFHDAAAGEGRQTAGYVDGQQMGVFKQDFEVLRGGWFDPG